MIPQDEIRISNKLIVLRKFFNKYLDIEVKQIRYSREEWRYLSYIFSDHLGILSSLKKTHQVTGNVCSKNCSKSKKAHYEAKMLLISFHHQSSF